MILLIVTVTAGLQCLLPVCLAGCVDELILQPRELDPAVSPFS